MVVEDLHAVGEEGMVEEVTIEEGTIVDILPEEATEEVIEVDPEGMRLTNWTHIHNMFGSLQRHLHIE